MNTDSSFYIGDTHEICEDYTSHGYNYIIVLDGCSSSEKTDIGARIIAECIKKYNCYDDLNYLSSLSIEKGKSIGLENHYFCCTYLSAFVLDESLVIQTIGDGNIIIKLKDGSINVFSMDYFLSAPYYINYLYDKQDDQLWNKIENNLYTIEYSIIKNSVSTYKDNNYKFDNSLFNVSYKELMFSPKFNKIIINKDSVEWVALSSDGLGSFYEQIETETSRYNKPINYIEVIKELIEIKNSNGRFVQRRLNRFRKECLKKNWHHADDISLAILYLG